MHVTLLSLKHMRIYVVIVFNILLLFAYMLHTTAVTYLS